MLHLMIENLGVCPPQGFTLFGATTKRYIDDPRMIGNKGSGNKHSTCLLLRASINPVVFCGSQKLSFFTKTEVIKGVGRTTETQRVCVRYGGKTDEGRSITREEELSASLDYGTADWPDICLALREYVSNALDACFEQGMDVPKAVKHVRVEVVDENQVRAKAGHTRVFVPLVPDVQRFRNELGKWFLHFSEPHLVDQAILPKAGRNLVVNGKARNVACIYRRGVFVREWNASDTPSLFDYNLNNLRLNESRVATDPDIKYACGDAICGASKEQLATVFRALAAKETFWEAQFDGYTLSSDYEEDEVKKERAANWQAAFAAVAGENGVLMSGGQAAVVVDMVTHKGYTPLVTAAEGWVRAAGTRGIKGDLAVLTEDDRVGRTYSEATPAVKAALDFAWQICVTLRCTNGLPKPAVRCFYEPMVGESQTFGRVVKSEVLIHTEIAGAVTDFLKWVMVEEVGHYITGATDMSRDFQTFFIRGFTKLATMLCEKS